MPFEWDEDKNKKNLLKHGINFETAIKIFQSIRFTKVDSRKNYGEVRHITIGLIGESVCIVVFTLREGRTRIISARKANGRERRIYYEKIREA